MWMKIYLKKITLILHAMRDLNLGIKASVIVIFNIRWTVP